jgi:hypothetical protein
MATFADFARVAAADRRGRLLLRYCDRCFVQDVKRVILKLSDEDS